MQCPRCENTEIDRLELGEVMIDRCPACGGLWFDHTELEAVTGNSERLRQIEASIPKEGTACAAVCPRCQVPLRPLALSSGEGEFEIDRCPSCLGSWIDRVHLRKIEDRHLISVLKVRFDGVK